MRRGSTLNSGSTAVTGEVAMAVPAAAMAVEAALAAVAVGLTVAVVELPVAEALTGERPERAAGLREISWFCAPSCAAPAGQPT
jgi:hypothetical protein